MKNRLKQGFTLIELLVVIAIIGVLSGVVLASLNGARARASDAAVKVNLNHMRAQADLYYDNHGSLYSTVAFPVGSCPTTVSANNMFSDQVVINAIDAALSAAGVGATSQCVSGSNSYAISVSLKTAGQSWCIDSLGTAKQYAGTPAEAITGGLCTP